MIILLKQIIGSYIQKIEKADKLYNQYLENKVASKALKKTKKERANNT